MHPDKVENPTPRDCAVCKQPLPLKKLSWKTAKYCSRECQRLSFRMLAPAYEYKGLSAGSVGALHEMMVACDLMKRGLSVFRAISPSCGCDLAVLSNGKLFRLEVTTGYVRVLDGGLSWPKHKEENFDIIAVVSRRGIDYMPDLVTAGIAPTIETGEGNKNAL